MKPKFTVIDTKTGEQQMNPVANKIMAKGTRNKLNDKHNGWPVDKQGKRIPDAMPRFVVSKV